MHNRGQVDRDTFIIKSAIRRDKCKNEKKTSLMVCLSWATSVHEHIDHTLFYSTSNKGKQAIICIKLDKKLEIMYFLLGSKHAQLYPNKS